MRNKLSLDNLYTFSYNDPKTKNLPMWDKRPLVFTLDIDPKRKSFLGLNLHWIPKKERESLLNDIIRILESPTSDRTKTRLTYGLILKPKYRRGLKGIRRYIISRVTNLSAIPHTQWEKVLNIKRYKEVFHVSDEVMAKVKQNLT